jgi:hypothetical protein
MALAGCLFSADPFSNMSDGGSPFSVYTESKPVLELVGLIKEYELHSQILPCEIGLKLNVCPPMAASCINPPFVWINTAIPLW